MNGIERAEYGQKNIETNFKMFIQEAHKSEAQEPTVLYLPYEVFVFSTCSLPILSYVGPRRHGNSVIRLLFYSQLKAVQ